MQVVYVYKSTGKDIELRYSLRSLANLPVKDVWIVGDCPDWVRNVKHVRVPQTSGTKYRNTSHNLEVATALRTFPDDFVIFHDDFFVLQPMTSIPVLHRGRADDIIDRKWSGSGNYRAGFRQTVKMLKAVGISNPLCYELHVPRTVNKSKWREANAVATSLRARTDVALHGRTFYGNYWNVGGDYSEDFKVYSDRRALPDRPFVSTEDRHFTSGSLLARAIKDAFPAPSIYEDR